MNYAVDVLKLARGQTWHLLDVIEQRSIEDKSQIEDYNYRRTCELNLKQLDAAIIATEEAASSAAQDIRNAPIARLELSVRARKCLLRRDISTIGELIQRTALELLGAKNFGECSLRQIQRSLAKLNLYLMGDKA